MQFTIGKKQEMTQIYSEDGYAYPVTIVDIANVKVVATRTKETVGYNAVVLGKDQRKAKNKADASKFANKMIPAKVFEFKIDDLANIEIGSDVNFEAEDGTKLNIVGFTKGKGFAGVVKRWGFKGGPKTHGQSDRHRAPGSIGSGTTPGRVYKGKKMGGRMGGERQTVQGLKLIKFDKENSKIYVKGAVPGAKGGYLLISKSIK